MDRQELNELLRRGPCRIRINDGRSYVVENWEMVSVSDIAAAVLHRYEDGKLRHVYLPLVTMTAVEPWRKAASSSLLTRSRFKTVG